MRSRKRQSSANEKVGRSLNPLQKIVGCALFCLLSVQAVLSQTHQEHFSFEFLTFRSGEGQKTHLEINCQIPVNATEFAPSETGCRSKYRVSISLYDGIGHQVDWNVHRDSLDVPNQESLAFLKPYVVSFSFRMPVGKYKVVIRFIDLVSLTHRDFDRIISVPDYRQTGLRLSDLQIAAAIRYAQDASPLVRNHWEILPNVPRVFGANNPFLCVYAELYNLNIASGEDAGLVWTFIIRDRTGQEVKTVQQRNVKFAESTTLIAKIPIQELSTGHYQLLLKVKDLDSGEEAKKSAYFNVSKSSLVFENFPLNNKIIPAN